MGDSTGQHKRANGKGKMIAWGGEHGTIQDGGYGGYKRREGRRRGEHGTTQDVEGGGYKIEGP